MSCSSIPPLPLPPPPRVDARHAARAVTEEPSSFLASADDQTEFTGPRGAAVATGSMSCPVPDSTLSSDGGRDIAGISVLLGDGDTFTSDNTPLPLCSVGLSDSIVSSSNVQLLDESHQSSVAEVVGISRERQRALDEQSCSGFADGTDEVEIIRLAAQLELVRCQQTKQEMYVTDALEQLEQQAGGLAAALNEIAQLRDLITSALQPLDSSNELWWQQEDTKPALEAPELEGDVASVHSQDLNRETSTPSLEALRAQLFEIREALLAYQPCLNLTALQDHVADTNLAEQEVDLEDADNDLVCSSSASSEPAGEESPGRGVLCMSDLAAPDFDTSDCNLSPVANRRSKAISAPVCTPPIAVRASFTKYSADGIDSELEKYVQLQSAEIARSYFTEQTLAIEGAVAIALEEARKECQQAAEAQLRQVIECAQESLQATIEQQREQAESDAASLREDIAVEIQGTLKALNDAAHREQSEALPTAATKSREALEPGCQDEGATTCHGVSTAVQVGSSKTRKKSRVRKLFCLCPSLQRDSVTQS